MRTGARWLVPLLVLLLGGCGLIVIEDEWHDRALDGAIRDVAAEVDLHYAALARAADGATARAELERHARAMDDRARALRAHVNVMLCDDDGPGGMMGYAVGLEARVATYVGDALAAPTLADLRALCAAYAGELDELLEELDDRADALDCRDPR